MPERESDCLGWVRMEVESVAALAEAKKAQEARLAGLGAAAPTVPKRAPPKRPKPFVPGSVLSAAQHKAHLTAHLAQCEVKSGALDAHLAEHAEKLFDGAALKPAPSLTPRATAPAPAPAAAGAAPPAASTPPRPQSAPGSPSDAREAARRAKEERQQRAREAAAAGKLTTSPKPASPAVATSSAADKPSLTPRRTVSEEDRAAARKLREERHKRASQRSLNSSPLPSTPEAGVGVGGGGGGELRTSASGSSPVRRTVSEAERAAARKAREERQQKARERAGAAKAAQ